MGLELVLVFALQLRLFNVQVNGDFLILLELHDDKGISRLALAQRRIQANDEQAVHLVRLGQDHELFDRLVLDFVVVRLSTESERGFVHVDIKTTSVSVLEKEYLTEQEFARG
jgi:hypothetical protein